MTEKFLQKSNHICQAKKIVRFSLSNNSQQILL
jgi:hypothetical protein